MPFGRIFGAIYFGGLCTWIGLGLFLAAQGPAMAAGFSLVVLGLSLAVGLLSGRRWPRWVGSVCAGGIAVFSLGLVARDGEVIDHLLLFASLAAAVLLLLPATGRQRGPSASRGGVWLKAAATLGLAGLLAAGWWAGRAGADPRAEGSSALPASALGGRIVWTDFGTGLSRARAEGKPVLATFVTRWCPYCKKMDRSTWKDPSVIDRVGDLVAVRVDAEERRERGGYRGADLAQRFDVSGYPVLLLLDGRGQVLARTDGYMTPRQLLAWLDTSLSRSASRAAVQGTVH